jgi:ADP-ribosylglycohydrolase
LLTALCVQSFDTIAGVMLGTALGDTLGLPYEGLHPRRIARRLRRRAFAHSMVAGRGLVSDDTEHTCMVARALAVSGGDVEGFRRSLAGQLKWWFAMLPPGIGFATLRGAFKLLLGVSPDRSGVDSAGNGPAMRSALPSSASATTSFARLSPSTPSTSSPTAAFASTSLARAAAST